jgi:Undecaprenyl-phosphate galactose phosphotransferase WbaP
MNNPKTRSGDAGSVTISYPFIPFHKTEPTRAFLFLRRRVWNGLALALGDSAAITLSLLVAGAVRWWWMGTPMVPLWSWLLVLFWCGAAYSQGLLPGWGIGAVEELRRTLLLLAGIFSGVAVVLFLVKQGEDVSRLVLLSGFCLSAVLVPLTRTLVKRALIRRRSWGVPAVVYGDLKTGAEVIQSLREQQGCGYIPVGFFGDDVQSLGEDLAGVPVIGTTEEVTNQAPIAILAMSEMERDQALSLLDGPLATYRQVVIVPNLFEAQTLWVRASDLGGMMGLEITRNLLDPIARWTKLAVELTAIILTAPIWGPLCLLLAAITWLEDRTSPFFWQARVGQDGRQFKTLKFRTMVPNAERVLQQKLAEDPELHREWMSSFKLARDPRVTRVGRFLRKTSLDELPQLVNVLRGEMSLVGPRPLPEYHHRELPEQVRSLRERVRPGVTGLWQVSGRSIAGNAGMCKWDAYYVRNWSVWLDAVILVRTIKVVLNGEGAY